MKSPDLILIGPISDILSLVVSKVKNELSSVLTKGELSRKPVFPSNFRHFQEECVQVGLCKVHFIREWKP